ncbi:DNA cytosine methyltransferase [Shewanella sp. SG41-4]|uniref:DNA cytosine methyltransferase n=1 Tax=Shewanella sp. SG41-4 TaxID=2760976 RepID=UPI001600E4B1|nr:DNA cytosine methyltransferase [Shewanella sp. SG41-4]MBB1438597.1 DNA cytosine methyltransferase [Shewanella sp. SG41-4]|tara:strand:- start:104536 stop:106041 length:1506 start_codon:yes stop_codon:yes gene_type:complete
MNGLIVDNFCGGGGASTGIAWAIGRSVDIADNHDQDAIAMHTANHPDTLHYCESVFDIDPVQATAGKPVDLAWFSPDCTHFSKARGSKPVKKEIRGLAWVAVRWALKVRPRVMMLENVEEFKTWGPLIECPVTGEMQPDPERKGETFNAFVSMLSTGIEADHPSIAECVDTLGLIDTTKLIKGRGYKVEFKELRACDYGAPTIRKRLFMIARCDKQPIIWPKKTHAAPHDPRVLSGELKPWVTAADKIDFSLPCHSIFLTKEMAKEQGLKVKRPLADATLERIAIGTIKHVLENPNPFIVEIANWSSKRSYSINKPLKTITASPKGGAFSLVAPFMVHLRKNVKPTSLNDLMPTITAGGTHHAEVRLTMVAPGESGLTAEQEAGAVQVSAFLMRYYSSGGQWSSLDDPLATITTKDRIALVTVTWNNKTMVIIDIGIRMLTARELFSLQGFPSDYIIDGYSGKTNKTQQVARCGNSVPPQFAEALVRANLPDLCINTAKAA